MHFDSNSMSHSHYCCSSYMHSIIHHQHKFLNRFVVVVAVELKYIEHICTSFVAAVVLEMDTTYIYIYTLFVFLSFSKKKQVN